MMNRIQHRRRCAAPASRLRAGFTMIELMIAITISLMLLAALVALLINVNRNNSELAKANSQVENGRFAIQLLQNEIMQAGFWGSFVPKFEDRTAKMASPTDTDAPKAIPDPCLERNPANWNADYLASLVGIPVQSSSTVPGTCAGVVSAKKDNTDVLVMRRAASCVPGEANCEPLVAGGLYFQSSLCPADSQKYVIDTTGFTLQTGACNGAPAPLRKFVSQIYWIRNFAVSAGDGIPTLVRSQFGLGTALEHQSAVALIEGIEGFNVELGIDNTVTRGGLSTPVNYTVEPDMVDPATGTVNPDSKHNTLPKNRGDGIPDGAFVHCTAATPCSVGDLTNVVAVKLYVLARSGETTPGHVDSKTYQLGSVTLGPFNDGYKRHVFSTTVRVVNVSGRRETP